MNNEGMSCEEYTTLVVAGIQDIPLAVRSRMEQHEKACLYHQSRDFHQSAVGTPVTEAIKQSARNIIRKYSAVAVEEVNDPKGKYKVILDEVRQITAFCDNGSEVFGVISGFYPTGLIEVHQPLSVIMGPFIDPGSWEFQAKRREGEKLRKE